MTLHEGWYEDPQDPARLRWWDGAAWTTHTTAHPERPERDAAPSAEEAGSPQPVPPQASGPPVASAVGPSRSSSIGLLVVIGAITAIAVIIGITTFGTSMTTSTDTFPDDGAVDGPAEVAAGTLALGQTRPGAIATHGSWTIDLQVDSRAEVRIDVRGEAGFDPIATLSDGPRQLDRNDDRGDDGVDRVGGDPLDPLLELTLDPGTYQLEVTGFGPSFGEFLVFAERIG